MTAKYGAWPVVVRNDSKGCMGVEAWKKLGTTIAHNMIFIVPLCLAVGIAVPTLFVPLKPLVSTMFAFVTFQGSLGNSFQNIRHTVKHPLPMFAAILIAQVIIPVLAYLLGNLFFGYDQDIVTGMVLEYCVPIAVTSSMWVGIYEGNLSLALGTLLISALISPITIPLTLKVLLGAVVQVDVAGMVFDMVYMVAGPAILGTLINARTHGWAKRELSPRLMPAARILVILVITTNSTALSDFMRNLTPEYVGVIVFIAGFASLGYLLGYGAAYLLRLREKDAITLTFCSALRNIASGAIIAQAYFAPATMFPVMTGTLFNQFLAAVFGRVLAGKFDMSRSSRREHVARQAARLALSGQGAQQE